MSGGKRVENTPAGQRAARGGVKPGAVIAVVVVALLKLSPVYVVVGCAVLSFIFGKKEGKA